MRSIEECSTLVFKNYDLEAIKEDAENIYKKISKFLDDRKDSNDLEDVDNLMDDLEEVGLKSYYKFGKVRVRLIDSKYGVELLISSRVEKIGVSDSLGRVELVESTVLKIEAVVKTYLEGSDVISLEMLGAEFKDLKYSRNVEPLAVEVTRYDEQETCLSIGLWNRNSSSIIHVENPKSISEVLILDCRLKRLPINRVMEVLPNVKKITIRKALNCISLELEQFDVEKFPKVLVISNSNIKEISSKQVILEEEKIELGQTMLSEEDLVYWNDSDVFEVESGLDAKIREFLYNNTLKVNEFNRKSHSITLNPMMDILGIEEKEGTSIPSRIRLAICGNQNAPLEIRKSKHEKLRYILLANGKSTPLRIILETTKDFESSKVKEIYEELSKKVNTVVSIVDKYFGTTRCEVLQVFESHVKVRGVGVLRKGVVSDINLRDIFKIN